MSSSLFFSEDDPFFILSPDMLCIIGINGHFKHLNPAWERSVGFSISELRSRHYLEWIHPEDRKSVGSALQRLTLGTESICFESRQLCQDGCYRWYAWTVALWGTEGLLYGILRDITAHRQTIEALQQAELRYRSIFENATEGIFQSTPDGRYLNINPALVRIYGYDSAEELKKQLTDIGNQLYADPGRRQEFAQLMQERGTVEEFESIVYRKDGREIWISEDAHAVYDGEGELLYYEGSVRDITARKVAEAALRDSEAHNRVLLNAIPDVMFCIHRNGSYRNLRVPADFEALFAMGEAEGQAIQQSLLIDITHYALPHVERALETGDIQVFEYPWSLNSRSREYEVRLVVSGTDEVLAIVRDITDRKQVERLKNEFVSVVSHELRTPLTSIRGSLGLVCGGVVGELPAPVKDLIQIAYKNSERLVLLINDILDVEKIESGQMNFEMKTLALVPLVEQAIEANRAYGEQYGVQFSLETSLQEVKVQADANRLIQVLTNLLSNAAKFSPRNETVYVAVVSEGQSWVRVTVSDRGSGIPENFRNRIFQKFAQADASDTRQKGGTGLGLSISKAIIERMGGSIGFQTETNVGTTFYFDLPRLVEPESCLKIGGNDRQATILICEDNPDIAHLLKLILQQGGFLIDVAPTAAEARELLSRNRYAAMTVDLVLPDQDGISLIRELRQQEHTCNLPVVVVSANAYQGYEELRGGSFAVVDFLQKPIDQSQLLEAVGRAVMQKLVNTPRILHVEDDPDILQVVATILRDVAIVSPAATMQEASQILSQEKFDLVILDLNMPDGSGLQLLPHLNCNGEPVPVVVFSAQEVGLEIAQQVTTALVKSRTSNHELLDTIKALITPFPSP